MLCTKCGIEIHPGYSQCPRCGASVESEDSSGIRMSRNLSGGKNSFLDSDRGSITFLTPPTSIGGSGTRIPPTWNPPVTPPPCSDPPRPPAGDYPLHPVSTASVNRSPAYVSFGKAVQLFFINYANFEGRSTRSEYWWAYLMNVLLSIILIFIPIVGILANLALVIPNYSIKVRRLHDVGKRGTYLFLTLIPVVGGIYLLVKYCTQSDGDNQWGSAAIAYSKY